MTPEGGKRMYSSSSCSFTAVGNHILVHLPPPSDPEWDQTNKIFVLTNYNVLIHNYPLLTQTQWSEPV